jgi:hypothetical protein
VFLISSGNFSFLNWLTMVAGYCVFGCALLFKLLHFFGAAAATAATTALPRWASESPAGPFWCCCAAQLTVLQPLCPEPGNNSSFDPLRFMVNTYGAFGTVGEQQGSSSYRRQFGWPVEGEFKVKRRVRSAIHITLSYGGLAVWTATCQNIEQSLDVQLSGQAIAAGPSLAQLDGGTDRWKKTLPGKVYSRRHVPL